MTVAAFASFMLGQNAESLTLVFLYSISEALEGHTEDKTRNAVRALMKLAPSAATETRHGIESDVHVAELRVNDVFLVRPDQIIPTDGVVIDGTLYVNQATLTGEAHPVLKRNSDSVFAGTSNGDGVLWIKVTKTTDENTLARIIRLVEDAQGRKAQAEQTIRTFGKWYSPFVLAVGALIAFLPGVVTGVWLLWVERATVFIVAASPCALIISVPITVISALGLGARSGILIKGGTVLEQLANARVFAFEQWALQWVQPAVK